MPKHGLSNMESTTEPARVSRKMVWIGRLIGFLPVPLLLLSAYMKLSKSPMAVDGFAKGGYPPQSLLWIGVVELACTVLYLAPQTAVLGAILLTGYLGGAVKTHVRAGEPFIIPVLFGVLVWLGLFFRDPRVRTLIPVRRLPA